MSPGLFENFTVLVSKLFPGVQTVVKFTLSSARMRGPGLPHSWSLIWITTFLFPGKTVQNRNVALCRESVLVGWNPCARVETTPAPAPKYSLKLPPVLELLAKSGL